MRLPSEKTTHFQATNWSYLPYSGKLSREKTFANFTVLWLFAKVFFAKFGGVASLAWHKWAVFSLRYLLLSTWCYMTSCPRASLMFTCWNNQHCRQQKPGNRAKSRKMWFVCCSYRLVGVLSVYETEESPLVHVASCCGLLNGSHSSQLSHIG